MNFIEVLNANGQLVTMLATVLEVGTSKLNKNNKPYQSAKLRDDSGEEHTVTINKSTGLLLDNNCLNQRLQFAMQTYQGQRGAAFSGYWNNTAQVSQQPPQQPTPAAPQSPNGGTEMRIVRGNALNAVMSATQVSSDMIKEYLLTSVQFILTGEWTLQQKRYQGSNQPTTADGRPIDDDIPF